MIQLKRNKQPKKGIKNNFKKNLLLKKGNIEKIHFWENGYKHDENCIRSSFNRELFLNYLNAIK